MKSDWNRIEDAVQVFVAKPVSVAVYAAWLAAKYLALAMTQFAAWLRRSPAVSGRYRQYKRAARSA